MSAIIEIVSCPLSLRKVRSSATVFSLLGLKRPSRTLSLCQKEDDVVIVNDHVNGSPFVPLKYSLLASLTAMRIEPISVNMRTALKYPSAIALIGKCYPTH